MKNFRQLKKAADLSLDRGDPRPATLLLKSYAGAAQRGDKEARQKAREISALLAKVRDITLPHPGFNPPQAYAQVQLRRRDPLAYLRATGRQQSAIHEIREVYSTIVKGLMEGAKPLDVCRVDRSRSVPDPLQFLYEHFLSHFC